MADPLLRRLVPRHFDALPDVERIARRNHWTAIESGDGDDWEVSWATGEDAVIRWYSDAITGVDYLVAEGQGHGAADHAIQTQLPLLNPNNYEVVYREQTTGSGRARVLYGVATAAGPDFEDRAFTLLSSAMRDRSPKIRSVAVTATSIPAWPEFRPLLERLSTGDPDPTVREDARAALRDLNRRSGQ